MEIFVNMTLKA